MSEPKKYKSLKDIESLRYMARGNIMASKRELEDIPNRIKELEAVIARAEKCLIEMDEAEEALRNTKRSVIIYLTEEEADPLDGTNPRWFNVRAILIPEGAIAKYECVEFEGKDYRPREFDGIFFEEYHHFYERSPKGWVETPVSRKEALEAALAAVAKIQAEHPEAVVFDSIPEHIYELENIPEPKDTDKWVRCI